MKIIKQKVTGDVFILSNSQYNDLLAENVKVSDGITARIYGIINKELVVGSKALVYLHGKVLGEIKNKGGTIYLFEPSGKVREL